MIFFRIELNYLLPYFFFFLKLFENSFNQYKANTNIKFRQTNLKTCVKYSKLFVFSYKSTDFPPFI